MTSEFRLAEYTFTFVETLTPERTASGAILELSPQGQYKKAGTSPLHKYGHGTFCKFRISVPEGLVGVYAMIVGGVVSYIGECTDLRSRFNYGYGNISPKNCYVGGQETNCRVNQHILNVMKDGGRVDLYFHPTTKRKAVEAQLIARYSPPWNGGHNCNLMTRDED
jgi:hypothetical protein